MHRYLVVANQTLGGAPLLSRIRELARAGDSAFHVVVPATPPADHAWTEGESRAVAGERLAGALRRLAEMDVQADGGVGDASPMLAIEDALREHGPFDAIVLSTLPSGPSRWLRLDLPRRVRSVTGLPLIHVVGEREPAGGPVR